MRSLMILGWDIGGVNTKVARVADDGTLTTGSRPFELQHDPDALVGVLRDLAGDVGASAAAPLVCAVTMTAELSQMFRTKREGVCFVLDAVSAAFSNAAIQVFASDGRFLTVPAARAEPLAVAAANWAATARLVASRYRDALLIDVGTTTTDIIPIVDGAVAAAGTTDPARLACGELVYSGALRTPVEAIVQAVPYRGGRAAVSAEGFALTGDVHVWRGRLDPADYTVPAPDGRPVAKEFCGERIARIICADRELIDEREVTHIADFVAAEQRRLVTRAITSVRSRHPALRCAVVTGLGEFIAREAADAVGLEVVSWADDIGTAAARYAPAAAVALLCRQGNSDRQVPEHPAKAGHGTTSAPRSDVQEATVELVIKVGGGLLEHVEHLDRVLTAIADLAPTRRIVVVPGGGPFADTVRRIDGRLALGDDEVHWMAVLGMDQHAHLLAARIMRGIVVSGRADIADAHRRGAVPVLAPSSWLSATDPLPHSWDVTSDSIAAWVAGELGARQLLLVKPPGARGSALVDPYFDRALPQTVEASCLDADAAIFHLKAEATITGGNPIGARQ